MIHPLSDKNRIRSHVLALRDLLSADFRKNALSIFTKHLLEVMPDHPSQVIGGYYAIRSEIDVMPALQEWARQGHSISLPVIQEKHEPLLFRSWQPGEVLIQGAYAISVPPETAPIVVPDILILPLLAFDKHGNRLGYGAGYYDRTIDELRAKGRKLLLIGAGYSMQQVDYIPSESHDQRLDAVVTEKGIVRFS